MAIDLITGHQGVAHISAEQIANINNALMDDYGVDKVVRLDDGTLTQDGLSINVGTGFWRVNGFDMEIQEAETIYVDPTATGLSRIDNIYVEILQDIPTGAQRSEIVTVQGEAAASPVAPDAPTAPVLNTDILLQVTPLATVTVTEGAMVMTDLSVAYEMVTPQELAAVQTIAENAQTAAGNAQTTADTASTNATRALNQIADSDDAYSPSKPYKVGEHCIYNNTLYECITACSAAAWSVNQNCFKPTTLTKAVTDLNNDLNGTIIPITYNNGYTVNSTGLNAYIKIGNVVTICEKVSIATPSSDICFTLPAGYRPSNQINSIMWFFDDFGLVSVESNGNVRLRNKSGGLLVNAAPSFCISFIAQQ